MTITSADPELPKDRLPPTHQRKLSAIKTPKRWGRFIDKLSKTKVEIMTGFRRMRSPRMFVAINLSLKAPPGKLFEIRHVYAIGHMGERLEGPVFGAPKRQSRAA